MSANTWITSDLPAAAFAVLCGLHLTGVEPGGRANFVFAVRDGWPLRLATFQAGTALVEPRGFWNATRALRRALLEGDLQGARDLAALARVRESEASRD